MDELMKNSKILFDMNLKYLRKCHRLSQAELGSKVGLGQHTISDYERNKNQNPTLSTLLSLSTLFCESVESLLYTDIANERKTFNYGSRRPTSDEADYCFFEGRTFYVYYFPERNQNDLRSGKIVLANKYDKEHAFLSGTIQTYRCYDCKMVIEKEHTLYIYGICKDKERRFHIAMYYPEMVNRIEYIGGISILTRVDSIKKDYCYQSCCN